MLRPNETLQSCSYLERFCYVLVFFALFLPFTSFRDCNGNELQQEKGYELLLESDGQILLFDRWFDTHFVAYQFGLAMVLFCVTFFPQPSSHLLQGMMTSLKASLAISARAVLWIMIALSEWCSFFTGNFGNFDIASGLLLSFTSWTVIYIVLVVMNLILFNTVWQQRKKYCGESGSTPWLLVLVIAVVILFIPMAMVVAVEPTWGSFAFGIHNICFVFLPFFFGLVFAHLALLQRDRRTVLCGIAMIALFLAMVVYWIMHYPAMPGTDVITAYLALCVFAEMLFVVFLLHRRKQMQAA